VHAGDRGENAGVTITGHAGAIATGSGPPQSPPSDGVIGQFQVTGAQRVVINDLLLGSTSGTVTLPPGYPNAQCALLFVFQGGEVFLVNAQIQGSPARGIYAVETSSINIQSSLITENGDGQSDPRSNAGIQAVSDSSIA
jgi:hypothetical protein